MIYGILKMNQTDVDTKDESDKCLLKISPILSA